MKKYQLIVMSFDGEYKREFHSFESIDKAWNYSNDMGSRWFFYPFHFITTESGKTIVDSGYGFEACNGRRVKYIQACFKVASKKPCNADADVESYKVSLIKEASNV